METATSLAIGQLSNYLRGLTQRLDPAAGWYGEFLRRDPEGMRACLDGAAMPPWDVVESLLSDLAEARGAEFAARETQYAARLRAAAVTAWDRLPGGVEELRTLWAAAVDQRAASEAAVRSLTAQLAATTDRAAVDALTRELAWTRDDAVRAAARHEDLTARLAASPPTGAGYPPGPQGSVPADPLGVQPVEPPAGAGGPSARSGTEWPVSLEGPAPAPDGQRPSGPWAEANAEAGELLPGVPRQGDAGEAAVQPPVGRAEGRWLRGARRAGGARYAGSAAPESPVFTPPPGHPDEVTAPPRGARFGRTGPELPAPRGARFAPPQPEVQPIDTAPIDTALADSAPANIAPADGVPRAVAELIALRAQGRSGEAHVLLCEAAARPAEWLPFFAVELTRAGLGADWAVLLWEAASLPPDRLAAVAAALGEAGRHADCEALLRQGVARPPAEIAEAALALAACGRSHEADALLSAFVRARTAEEAARLARRDPQWFAPRLLRAAEALSTTHHRDLVHALRVAKPSVS
ncbi:hypothetical protein ABZZ20_07725 [Streptomyces sp. NPDC006430]|uniref:hypothetical protein n=1 Tax=Streptomyces sp. NPDC006430 TaxID=3154299 RepID=UPI0033B2EAF2